MSFFDDDDDEPIRASRTRPARPRAGGTGSGGARAASGGGGPRPPSGRGGGTRRPDPRTVRQRQLVLGGAAVVLVIIVVLLISSCQSSRKEQALKDYNRSVTTVTADSDKVSSDFFAALNAAGSGSDVEVRVNQLRLRADDVVKRAQRLDPPSEMRRAQNSLELMLNLRAQAVRKIGDKLPSALVQGRDRAQSVEKALTQIAGQNQQFLASDVISSQRVAPYIREALGAADVKGQRVSISSSLPSLAWLNPNSVADRLGAQRAGGGTGANPNPAPGLHGHGLTSVSVGATTLQPGSTGNSVPARPAPQFTVKFANGGDNDETDVAVTVQVSVKGGRPIVRRKTLARSKAKSDMTVVIPLGVPAPTGAGTVTVSIAKVPGETALANNKQTYTVLFRG